MTPFVMSGVCGRMGRAIVSLSENPNFGLSAELQATGALESPGNENQGKSLAAVLGLASGTPAGDVLISSDASSALAGAKVVIDFSSPDNSVALAAACARAGCGLLIGTTGMTDEQRSSILSHADRIPIMIAPNTAVGVNVLFHLTKEAARILGDEYDAEIIEAHHRFKKDAPSGTALRLKDILLSELERKEDNVVYGRHGDSPRQKNEIGVHAMRGGDAVGEHTVYFFTEGERLELTIRSTSRDTYAAGALRAARFLASAGPGEYGMGDVLNL